MEQPEAPSFADVTIRDFVDRLASAEPVPGGGSASAIAAGLGAALVAMVAALSRDRPAYAEHGVLHADVEEEARELAAHLIRLAGDDANAYGEVAAALKQPRDAAGRGTAIAAAAKRATQVPLETLEACLDVVAAAEALAGRSNRNAASDLNVAVQLVAAAARGAAANVRVNLPSLDPAEPLAAEAEQRVETLLAEVERLAKVTRDVVASRETREPMPGAAPPGATPPGATPPGATPPGLR